MNTLMVTADVVVVRDDAGASGTRPFRALVDSDRLPGKIVARGVRFPFRAMGKTDGATKVLIHRAIKQLEEIVAKEPTR